MKPLLYYHHFFSAIPFLLINVFLFPQLVLACQKRRPSRPICISRNWLGDIPYSRLKARKKVE